MSHFEKVVTLYVLLKDEPSAIALAGELIKYPNAQTLRNAWLENRRGLIYHALNYAEKTKKLCIDGSPCLHEEITKRVKHLELFHSFVKKGGSRRQAKRYEEYLNTCKNLLPPVQEEGDSYW